MLKDKKISIIGFEEYRDRLGSIGFREVVVAPNIWAYYRHSTAKEKQLLHAMETKVDVIFIINYRKDIDVTNRIKFRDEVYNISQIDDFEGYKSDLKVYAYKKTT